MSDAKLAQDSIAPLPEQSAMWRLIRRLAYVTVLALAIFGIAYTNISRQPLNYYWEFLTAAMALLCVATGWPRAADRDARLRLVWTQALHWVTILATMYIVLLPGFQSLLPVPASSSGDFDVARARNISGGDQLAIRGNLLSWPSHGRFGASDSLAQRGFALFALGCSGRYRAWHRVLAAREE